MQRGMCENVKFHSKLLPSSDILWIEQGGKPK